MAERYEIELEPEVTAWLDSLTLEQYAKVEAMADLLADRASRSQACSECLRAKVGLMSSIDSGHSRWERTGAQRHDAAYAEARAALLLGQMVHDRRVALGLTQAELAARAGMTQPQLSRLESGGATPTVPLLARLAAGLDAELDITFRPSAA
jgi:ribosome-binding protein aMBF1 (putative translation factor)